MSAERESRYVPSLDGLRGLAAIVVLIRHTFNAVSMPFEQRRFLIEGPFALLFNAQGAVQIFFVLSGYVLAASLDRNRHWIDLAQYYVKRVFRIYPPFIAAVLFAWVLSFNVEPIGLRLVDGLTPMMARRTHVQVSADELLADIWFPGQARGLLDVGWTLEVEMVFSIVLPAMLLIARRLHWSILLSLSLASLVFLSGAVHYSLHFTLGLIGYLERERIGSLFSRMPAALRALVVLLGVALICLPSMLGWSQLVYGVLALPPDPESLLFMGLGSFVLVTVALHVPRFRQALSLGPIVRLGKISFSVYLLHMTILTWLAPRLIALPVDWIDRGLLLAAVMVSTIVLAELTYRLLEVPAIRVGNQVCAAVAKGAGRKSVRSELADRD